MILSIPYQRFEITNIQLHQFMLRKYNRNIALLTYQDDMITFKDITLLTPPMKVLQYNTKTSMLRLDVSDEIAFQLKMYTFYEYVTNLLFMNQYAFFNETQLSYEMIRQSFYTMLTKSVLSLYIHPASIVKHSEKETDGVSISDVHPGDMVRCIIRIQGISQLLGKDGLRLRLHHSVPSIWKSA
jgi:hypothetical protein